MSTNEAPPAALMDAITAAAKGRASAIKLKEGVVSLVLDVTGLSDAERDVLGLAVRGAGKRQPGVSEVRVAMTAERAAPPPPKAGPLLIAVASGKGGVGKSTVSTNLAVALSRLGHRVGLVDADIYGPSQARLLGVEGKRPQAQEKQLIPVPNAAGIPLLSMGNLSDPGQAIAWRGPMASNALGQLIDADWGDTQLLIVDMPPGTGDVQLSMVQKHKPAGVVIVSTPQDLALIDAARAVDLFEKSNVPLIGLIENMAGYVCPHCGEVSDPFGAGGAEDAAGELGLPFLGRIPLDAQIRKASDDGTPPAAGGDEIAGIFLDLAHAVAGWLTGQAR